MSEPITAKVLLEGWKRHTCGGCGCVFRCRFAQEAVGTGKTEEEALRDARGRAIGWAMGMFERVYCPHCGQAPSRLVGWVCVEHHLGIISLSLFLGVLWVVLGATGAMGYETAAIVAASCALLDAIGHTAVSIHAPNRNLEANLAEATRRVEAGLTEVLRPGRSEGALPPPPVFTARHVWFLQLGILAVVLPLLVIGVRLAAGWPRNADTRPLVVGPGDTFRLRFPDEIESIGSLWRGDPRAAVDNAAEFDFPVNPSVAANDDEWDGTLKVKSSSKRTHPTLWVDVTVPAEKRLAGRSLRLSVGMVVTYPELRDPQSYVDVQKTVSASTEVHLASPRAGLGYLLTWWLTMLGGVASQLASGLGMLAPARHLRNCTGGMPVIEPDIGGPPWDPYAPNFGQPLDTLR